VLWPTIADEPAVFNQHNDGQPRVGLPAVQHGIRTTVDKVFVFVKFEKAYL
jgi:hypothetical protein